MESKIKISKINYYIIKILLIDCSNLWFLQNIAVRAVLFFKKNDNNLFLYFL